MPVVVVAFPATVTNPVPNTLAVDTAIPTVTTPKTKWRYQGTFAIVVPTGAATVGDTPSVTSPVVPFTPISGSHIIVGAAVWEMIPHASRTYFFPARMS